MPARIDYLRDLRENPGATAEEVQRRVQAPSLAAVETQFRKCASVQFVECDESKPKRYTLTEKGTEELQRLEPQTASAIVKSSAIVESNDTRRMPSDEANSLPALAQFFVHIGEQARKFVAERQSASVSDELQSGEARVSRARVLFERIRAIEEANTPSESNSRSETEANEATHAASDVAALYLARHELRSFGWSDRLFGEDNQVRARVAELEGNVGEEIGDQVKRLVSVEWEIHDDLWSDGTDMLRRVLALRAALHLPASVFGLGNREADSSGEGEGEDAQG